MKRNGMMSGLPTKGVPRDWWDREFCLNRSDYAIGAVALVMMLYAVLK